MNSELSEAFQSIARDMEQTARLMAHRTNDKDCTYEEYAKLYKAIQILRRQATEIHGLHNEICGAEVEISDDEKCKNLIQKIKNRENISEEMQEVVENAEGNLHHD